LETLAKRETEHQLDEAVGDGGGQRGPAFLRKKKVKMMRTMM
jgi:hypothetical protein